LRPKVRCRPTLPTPNGEGVDRGDMDGEQEIFRAMTTGCLAVNWHLRCP
jgi:hypothetical protein